MVTIDLARFSEVSLRTTAQADGAVLVLLNDEDRIVARTPDIHEWFNKRIPTPSQFENNALPPTVTELRGIDGVQRAYGGVRLQAHGGRVVAGISTEWVQRNVEHKTNQAILVMLLAAASGLAAAWLSARRLASPLKALETTARRLAKGQHELRADENQPGEFGALAYEFNAMVDALVQRGTALMHSEKQAVRLAQLYRALSDTRRAKAQSSTMNEVFDSVCRICVETGAAHSAWIGTVKGNTVKPVAGSDRAVEFLQGMEICWTDDTRTWGPIGTAVRTGRHAVSRNFQQDPHTKPWHERAVQFGIRSSAVFPLREDGRLFAVLVVYMSDEGALDNALTELLLEIANDVSRAADSFRSDEALHEAERLEYAANARFLRVFNIMPVPACLYSNTRSQLLQVNDAYCSMYGVERESLIGSRPREFKLGLDKASLQDFEEQLASVGHLRNLQGRLRVASGELRDVLTSAERLEFMDEDCVLVLHVDITGQLRAVQALHEREQQLAGIINSAMDAIITVDANQRIIVFNDTAVKMFGVPSSEALGGSIERFIPSPQRGPFPCGMGILACDVGTQRAISSSRRLRGLRSDGSDFPIEATVSRMGDGESMTVTVVIRDVSELQRAQAALIEHEKSLAANRAKTEFLSRMSHELRTPLNAILGFSQLLQASTKGRISDSENHQLDLVFLAGAQLRALIDDVLDVSRIEAGSMNIELRTVELTALLDGVLKLSENMARERQVELVRDIDNVASVKLRTDPIRLRQIILNILTNAIKYNREGGSVHLRAERRDNSVVLCIVDTGIGMSEAQMAKLYQPFNRLGRERSTVEGTGIGLVLTRQLVELLGGHISISSREGQGTEVSIRLPSVDASTTEAGLLALPGPNAGFEAAAWETVDPSEPSGVVLYVEDNPVNVALVEQLVSRWPGVKFVVAEDGATGLQLCTELMPNVVLLDMQLPDMSGVQVLKTLRSDPATRSLQVVALSANAMAPDIREALDAGADDYWTKPLDFETFIKGMLARLVP